MNAISKAVSHIIETVRRRGDAGLCDFAKQFDRVSLRPADLLVSKREIESAKKRVSSTFLEAIRECAAQVERFARAEKRRLPVSWMEQRGSTTTGQWIRPVDSAGLYIPGGRFPYPSTVLMTAIPARVAGVQRVIMSSPPANLTPEVIVAASISNVDAIYRVGGAGAIAAMALGTQRIARVDFIVGPGNRFVTEAKRQLYGVVGIDSLAGPSEVVIIADRSARADFIQADLLAQAEHDPSAHATLLSTDARLIERVKKGLNPQIKSRVQCRQVASLDIAFDQANALAPEHLELLLTNAKRYLPQVRHAGAIFLGSASPAAMGDYVAGPSHVLPTSGAAHFSSGLSVATFLKRSSVIGFEGKASEIRQWKAALMMAETEGMTYHAKSLRCRLSSDR